MATIQFSAASASQVALSSTKGKATAARRRVTVSAYFGSKSPKAAEPSPKILSTEAQAVIANAIKARPASFRQPAAAVEAELKPEPVTSNAAGIELNVMPPTPVLPSGKAMADFLLTFGRMLQNESTSGSGSVIAAAGATVVERVRVGLDALLHHPVHGVRGGHAWETREEEVFFMLAELEKDLSIMRRYGQIHPSMPVVKMATIHCLDAAKAVRNL